MSCLLVFVYLIGFTVAGLRLEENCSNSQCLYNQPQGTFLVREDYMNMTHIIDVQNTSSIINLMLYPMNETKHGITLVYLTEEDRNTTWKLNLEVKQPSYSYLSHSSRLAIGFGKMNQSEEWTDLAFSYKEVKLFHKIYERMEDRGVLRHTMFGENIIKPNSMITWQLNPNPGEWNYSRVMITVDYLEMEVGDYLLLGEGIRVKNGTSIALLKENIKNPWKYQINYENAHIVLYHKGANKPKFSIKWSRSGEKFTDIVPNKPIPDSALQSVPICFYNKSWVSEFDYSGEPNEALSLFQQKFAEVANRYVKEKGMKQETVIKPESVKIFQMTSVILPDDNFPNGVIFATITIIREHDKKLAVFRWNQLEEIVKRFDTYDLINNHFFGFRIGNCPHEENHTWWYVAMIVMILLVATLSIGTWMCAYNSMCRARISKRKRSKLFVKGLNSLHKVGQHLCGQDYVAYENPTHKMMEEKERIANVSNHAVRYTTILSDEDSDAEVFDKKWMKKMEAELKQWKEVEAPPFKTCKGRQSYGEFSFEEAGTESTKHVGKSEEDEWKEERF